MTPDELGAGAADALGGAATAGGAGADGAGSALTTETGDGGGGGSGGGSADPDSWADADGTASALTCADALGAMRGAEAESDGFGVAAESLGAAAAEAVDGGPSARAMATPKTPPNSARQTPAARSRCPQTRAHSGECKEDLTLVFEESATGNATASLFGLV
jgi:type IV secretion system protein TrbL